MTNLGILIDDQLYFSPHIDTVCTKAKQRAALILNSFYLRNKYLLIRAFIAYVRPLLEYCCSLWSPSKLDLIDKLENIQRRFTKRLHGPQHLLYSERLKLLKSIVWNIVDQRGFNYVFKIFHQLIDLVVRTFFDIYEATTLKLNVLS